MTTRTAAEMALYVRHHQCWNADPDVSVADWHRGVLAIEADAQAALLRDLNLGRRATP